MELHAYVKDRETKELKLLSRDYPSKESFWRELEANGYIVRRISTDLDLKAMDYGFETWSALKKQDKWLFEQFGWYSELHEYILEGEAK